MAKTGDIQLGDGTRLPILHEDAAVLAIDKPAGWMLAPAWWDRTGRNLQLALESSLRSGAFWARCRHLRFLRFVHRLDADTSGVLLLARSPGALRMFSRLFEERRVEKTYLAVVEGTPQPGQWTATLKIGRDLKVRGRMTVNGAEAREAETVFRVLAGQAGRSLVLAQPRTGRTHQIRVHLAAAGHPVAGDALYGTRGAGPSAAGLALRAIKLSYADPFRKRPVTIAAPWEAFGRKWGFTALDPSWI